MIDPHVHLRDWNQSHKETLLHGLSVACRAGLDGVFEMPNMDPSLTSRETILRRIDEADRAISRLGLPFFHGLYAGLTPDPRQVEQVIRAHEELFPRVVGLKMFAGHSTGNMGIVEQEDQRRLYRLLAALGYKGVLAVHCEKEGLLRPAEWDPREPSSHGRARPPEAEVESISDQLHLARAEGFRGRLHIVHVSVPAALDLISDAKRDGVLVTCALTPHHALLSAEMMDGPDGVFLKTNPPLRPGRMPAAMLEGLFDGRIDWIETDHAPHSREEKGGGAAASRGGAAASASFASGIPVLPFYPRFVRLLTDRGMPRERVEKITHEAICRTFGISVPRNGRAPAYDLSSEYEIDPFERL